MNSRVLVIGDLHFPFHHQDVFPYLKEIKRLYKPDRVIQIGDETDQHSWSFHEHNPYLPNPEDELNLGRENMLQLEKLFPSVDLLESNHGSLVYRRQVSSGLPRGVFKDYNEIYSLKGGFRWHRDLTIELNDGTYVYFCHGKSADVLKVSMSMGMSVVQGHYHEKMGIQYWGNSLGLYFAAQTGCLVDDDSLAMEYNKTNLKRPLIGSLIIINGQPKQLPMILDSNGRWIGEIL